MRNPTVLWIVTVALAAACNKGSGTTTTTSASATASGQTQAVPAASASAAPGQETPAEETADEEAATEQLRTYERHHHYGGVAMFVRMATDTLGVPADEQIKLEKIRADLDAAMKPSREASRDVVGVLADGLDAGKIDQAKLDAAVAKETSTIKGVHAAATDAFDRLHATLTPEQRVALVEKVNASVAVWKNINVEEPEGDKSKNSHLERLAAFLDLAPDQVDKISTALKKNAPPKANQATIDAYVDAFDKAFQSDSFDAKTFTQADAANGVLVRHGSERMVHFYQTVTPLLTPAQRTKLAARLRERLNDHRASEGK